MLLEEGAAAVIKILETLSEEDIVGCGCGCCLAVDGADGLLVTALESKSFRSYSARATLIYIMSGHTHQQFTQTHTM